ncbi:transglutaminase family protein [uncultured Desulfuromusa sp.]|uniref:transglutaminase-like domain-containing protein n=1 Tax=uncultured Desulfuromusa sp. TaxID=219183 RepID=UPI002AA8B725|nr:transglutaminase family protein [uncultured Desulfuromusa sp.]
MSLKYDPGFTTISTPLSKVLSDRRGVCQDFAHLGVACLRSMGLAARYVSGYIETLPPAGPGAVSPEPMLHMRGFLFMLQVSAGLILIRRTINFFLISILPSPGGEDFADVSPLRGVALGGGKHKVSVSVDVCPAAR